MTTDFWSLPPWNQLPYCAAPIETASAATGTKLTACQANNRRIALFICCNIPANSITISTQASGLSSGGITIPSAMNWIYLSTNQHGILPTLQWFITTTGPWTVIEMIANDWPDDAIHPMDNILHPPTPPTNIVLPTAPGVGGKMGVKSYWQSLMAKLKGG